MNSFFSQLKRVLAGNLEKKVQPKKQLPPARFKPKPKPKPQSIASEGKAEAVLDRAQKEAAEIKAVAESAAAMIRREAEALRESAVVQEAEMGRKRGALEERERILEQQKSVIEKKQAEIEQLRKGQVAKLEKIASLTREQAKEMILGQVEKSLAEEIAQKVQESEQEIKSQAEEKAKDILTEAMQRGVTDCVVEYTVSTLKLTDEEMKGRIIGREGRNIRAFERATGVEIELDESNDIYLSSFDPIRREVARRSLEKLIKDRRIRPSRIEEVVQKTREEVDQILTDQGRRLCRETGVFRLHPDLVNILGRYKFRFSYGQNMAVHTLEVVKIGVAIAIEVKANVNIVRLACLLHDIGKVVTEEEGTHVDLGVDLAKKYRLPEAVVACIAEHHEDKSFSSAESRIVWVADAISGARPGARYEPHGEYVKRMTEIETAATSYPEVQAAFAYQAGREVRILIKPEAVSDSQLSLLARKIKEKLEKEVAYVGQIKVTCIRETRVTETTRAK
ncbi:MAG: ribonuclease Y [Candidatus Pacebacteria bacterium]|nr:ribonuclease Y [Candidatus Paceibacterota bacterium]